MQPTVSTDSVAADQIRAFVERILRMKEEAKAINDDIREIYAEAKGNGFDKTVLGQVVAYVEKRGKDHAALMEREALFDLYMEAFDGSSSHARARAREIIEEFPADVVVSDHVDRDGHRLRVVVDPRIAEILNRSDDQPHDEETGEIIEDNEPATEPPTVGGPVEGVAPPASSATQSTAARKDVPHEAGDAAGAILSEAAQPLRDTEAGTQAPPVDTHSMPDKSGEGDAPSPAPAPDSEPGNGHVGETPASAGAPAAGEAVHTSPAVPASGDGLYSFDWLRRNGRFVNRQDATTDQLRGELAAQANAPLDEALARIASKHAPERAV